MRLLYVTEGTPNRHPRLGDGSSLIPFEVIRALDPLVDITLMTFVGEVPLPPEVAQRCARVIVLPERPRWRAMVRSVALRGDIGTQQRATRAARRTVRNLSKSVDVTLIHGPHAAFLAHEVSGPLVLQVVDPWSLRVRMEAGLTRGWRALHRRRKAVQALQLERRLPSRARLLTVGRRDAQVWSPLLGRAVRSLPNGADPLTPRRRVRTRATVCFVGSLNYAPNKESAQALVREIAPLVWDRRPDVHFVLAGRQPDPEVRALAGERVQVLADVPDVNEVFLSADVAVFPDKHGLGIRNSVREAIASGLPVVATPAAARDQEPHPLLTVVQGTPEIVTRVLEVFETEPAAALLPSAAVADRERTWADVAADYVDELRSASARSKVPGR